MVWSKLEENTISYFFKFYFIKHIHVHKNFIMDTYKQLDN